jgi:peptidoglycan/LPS O-acetylase OafA/YrhL
MGRSSDRRSQGGRHAALDGIRAFAILAVFVSHLGLPGGWVGVEVFFVLSGYLITDRLLHEHGTTGRVGLSRFYLRRALRLYPALLALLLAGAFFYPVLGDGGTLIGYGRTAAFAGLYLQDFVWGFSGGHGGLGHTWSLAVEEQFYLLWPPVLLLLLRWSRRWIAVIAVAAAGAGLVWTIVGLEPAVLTPPAYFLPWTQAPLLLAGCALAACRRLPRGVIAGACAALGCAGMVAVFAAANGPMPMAAHLGVLLTGCALFSVALVAGVEGGRERGIARCLSWAPLAYLGRISYGYYLCYLPVIEVLNWLIPQTSSDVRAGLDLVATLVLAALSYHLLETPFLRLKARLEPLPTGIPAARGETVQAREEVPTPFVGRRSLPGVPAPRGGLDRHRHGPAAPSHGDRVSAGR